MQPPSQLRVRAEGPEQLAELLHCERIPDDWKHLRKAWDHTWRRCRGLSDQLLPLCLQAEKLLVDAVQHLLPFCDGELGLQEFWASLQAHILVPEAPAAVQSVFFAIAPNKTDGPSILHS